MDGFDKIAELQRRKVVLVLDKCSAHSVNYDSLHHVTQAFLPPKTTSALQPVVCAVGLSFKFAYRRLLVAHIFTRVNADMALDENGHEPFKFTGVVTAYDALRILRRAWDLVPKRVVLKAWLQTYVLSTPKHQDVEQLLRSCGNTQEPAMCPQFGSVTQTEACAANTCSVATKV